MNMRPTPERAGCKRRRQIPRVKVHRDSGLRQVHHDTLPMIRSVVPSGIWKFRPKNEHHSTPFRIKRDYAAASAISGLVQSLYLTGMSVDHFNGGAVKNIPRGI